MNEFDWMNAEPEAERPAQEPEAGSETPAPETELRNESPAPQPEAWNESPAPQPEARSEGPAQEAEPETRPAEPAYGQPVPPQQPVRSYEDSAYAYHYGPYDRRQFDEPVRTARPAQYAQPRYQSEQYGRQSEQPRYQAEQPAPQRKIKAEKKRGGFWKKALAAALACILLGGGAGVGGALLVNKLQSGQSKPAGNASTSVQVAAPRETAELGVITVESGKLMKASEVYKANVNSTVGITTEITTTNVWGFQTTSAAAGSGFILTEDGYILTNEHVIEDANSITVAMYDGTEYLAKLVGYDTSNDIAVLKIDAKGLTPVTLGDSDSLQVGDEVVAIGNPLGELTFSLTKGNVSALNRPVTLSSKVTMHLIQTDAAINSGNSGGALFNMYGEVVGITNAKYSSSGYSGQASIDNIGFAIPVNSVREIVSSIIEKGYISRPYIGVSVANVSEESQSYGMPKGAALREVEKDGPAAAAGLQANDIITAIDGKEISSYEELAQRIAASEPGDKLELTVYRKGETLTITVTIGEKKQDALPSQEQSQSGQNGQSGQSGQNGQSGQSGQEGQADPWGEGSEGFGGDPWGFGSFPWGFGFGG